MSIYQRGTLTRSVRRRTIIARMRRALIWVSIRRRKQDLSSKIVSAAVERVQIPAKWTLGLPKPSDGTSLFLDYH